MGKHDKVIEKSSEEFLQNRIKDLEKRLAFANDTNSKYSGEVNKYNKWMSEILDKDPPTITRLLNEVEWSRREQDEVIKKIREYANA